MTLGDDFTYGEYLHLDDLLALQHPLSEHPDELLFIVIHQAYELWFKLVLFELGRVRDAMDADNLRLAMAVLDRVHVIFRLVAQQISTLETIPPQNFHQFRGYLGSASGLQSFQFREIEVMSGLRSDNFLDFLERTYRDTDWPRIAAHLDKPSLRESWRSLLARLGIEDVIVLYQEPDSHHDVYMLAEALYEYDQLFQRWRFLHVQLVNRVIGGHVEGTGGTVQPYLDSTLKQHFFPGLWEVRNILTELTTESS